MAAIELYSTPLYSDANLEYYYRLNGNSNDAKGVLNGTDTSVSYSSSGGLFDQYADYDGTNSYTITSTDDPSWTSWSISFWMYRDANNDGKYLSERSNTSYSSRCWAILSQTGAINVYAWSSTGGFYNNSQSVTISNSAWHHVVVVWDTPNNKLRIYFDGSQLGTGLDTTGNAMSGTLGMAFASQYYSTHGSKFDGRLDDIAIFSRVLTPTEISNLYNGTWSSIKSINGLAKASVKSVNGLAIASVKSYNGLA